jgi:prevent-host-death family protein
MSKRVTASGRSKPRPLNKASAASVSKTEKEWSVADAKARFSEMLDTVTRSPQTITRNGKPVAVVVSVDEWKRKTQRKGTLADFFLSSPLRGSNLDLGRSRDLPRDVDL